jgi:hypothetical protein
MKLLFAKNINTPESNLPTSAIADRVRDNLQGAQVFDAAYDALIHLADQ